MAAGIEDELRAAGTPERAAGEKRYLKSDLDFLGVTVGQVRTAVRRAAPLARPRRPARGGRRPVDRARVRPPAGGRPPPRRPDRPARAGRPGRARTPDPRRPTRGPWSTSWPATSPAASSSATRTRPPTLDRWAADDDFWVRRSALLALREPLKRGLPLDRFLGYADAMLDEKEFFVRKAIGWVLREEGKRRPDEVVAWLAPRAHRASGVTLREAVKYLTPGDREALLAAYRSPETPGRMTPWTRPDPQPGRIHYRLRVGVTGHRHLADEAAVAAKVGEALATGPAPACPDERPRRCC